MINGQSILCTLNNHGDYGWFDICREQCCGGFAGLGLKEEENVYLDICIDHKHVYFPVNRNQISLFEYLFQYLVLYLKTCLLYGWREHKILLKRLGREHKILLKRLEYSISSSAMY